MNYKSKKSLRFNSPIPYEGSPRLSRWRLDKKTARRSETTSVKRTDWYTKTEENFFEEFAILREWKSIYNLERNEMSLADLKKFLELLRSMFYGGFISSYEQRNKEIAWKYIKFISETFMSDLEKFMSEIDYQPNERLIH